MKDHLKAGAFRALYNDQTGAEGFVEQGDVFLGMEAAGTDGIHSGCRLLQGGEGGQRGVDHARADAGAMEHLLQVTGG